MNSRLIAAVTRNDGGVVVAVLCRELGISTKTFYKWRRRYQDDGLAGLEERSRRPLNSPHALPAPVEEEIVRLRKELAGLGLDAGPPTIRYHLERGADLRDNDGKVPSVATIWRVLQRRGFIVPEPKKRPKSSYRRFQAGAPNEMWQMDFTHWSLADGEVVDIHNIIDDCSRLLVRSKAVKVANTKNAWAAFCEAIDLWGLPVACLTDNGLEFSGRIRGFKVYFETKLRAAGVRPINSRPYHPQTCGKVERFHQTLKKWLSAQPRAATIRQLQSQLDAFAIYYNEKRPHRSLGGRTPLERWTATIKSAPTGDLVDQPSRRSTATVSSSGAVSSRPYDIGVGTAHAGKKATVIIDNGHCVVLIDNDLIRCFELDPTRRYQPTGQPGGPKPRN